MNRVVPAEDLLTTARAMADEITAAAPLAVRAVLQAMRTTAHLDAGAALAALRSGEVPAYDAMLASEDAVEGPRAFAEGRRPEWRGR